MSGSGLLPRSEKEYAGVLRSALTDEGALRVDRVLGWSRSRRVVLRAALKHAGLTEVVVPEPPGRRRRRDLPVPNETELTRYEAAAEDVELAPGFRAAGLMPLRMGLRAQELLQLRRREVERAADVGELIFMRKGQYEARLPAGHVRQELRELLAAPTRAGKRPWSTVGQILSSAGGPHTQYCALLRLVRRLGRQAGLGLRLRPHLLRHGFATRLVRQGAPLPVIQRWLGHASSNTTQLYVHPEVGDLAKWVPGGR